MEERSTDRCTTAIATNDGAAQNHHDFVQFNNSPWVQGSEFQTFCYRSANTITIPSSYERIKLNNKKRQA